MGRGAVGGVKGPLCRALPCDTWFVRSACQNKVDDRTGRGPVCLGDDVEGTVGGQLDESGRPKAS